ncbi:uncharacterized protein RHIMIDRAFT_273232 [Rhizopus microsporus ATCC 52813]|uniref:Uncharacterized protein n=1 Tax=Rhizopus microsporus ATCC 52813 TaxID=1340429 RepID=A0A2G4T3U0_RHIZD|nr:uncharacterized protein RHIMIDRAFT_273232 [Rhizopus microsporus ATCC 52813]PHZ15680.1 hypothetical protein RHIMIDRAFT_273232 [Rhizopus microsporus ATCC 52813]
MEPLVKSIVFSQRIRGFSFPSIDVMEGASLQSRLSVPSEIKVLANADDLDFPCRST